MYLFVNTSNDETHIGILSDAGTFADEVRWNGGQNQSEELLTYVDELLLRHKLSPKKLTGIIVVIGPGSYTGLRVGVASANALALAFNLGVLGITTDQIGNLIKIVKEFSSKARKIASPHYINPPHITKPKEITH